MIQVFLLLLSTWRDNRYKWEMSLSAILEDLSMGRKSANKTVTHRCHNFFL